MLAFITALALSLLAVVSAEIFNVTVGPNSTLTYEPSSVTAANDDVVIFHFVSKNHTVTRSTFADPCTPVAGVVPVYHPATNTSHPTVNVTVTDSSSPVWFFCAQANHCIEGMVFALNPTADMSFDAFQAKAKSLNPNNTSATTRSSSVSSTGTSSTGNSPTQTPTNTATRLGGNTLGIITAVAVLFGFVL